MKSTTSSNSTKTDGSKKKEKQQTSNQLSKFLSFATDIAKAPKQQSNQQPKQQPKQQLKQQSKQQPNKQRNVMVLLVGYLAVGKSTIIKEYVGRGYIAISVDDLIERDQAYQLEIKSVTQAEGSLIYDKYRELYKPAYKNIVETLAKKKNIIIESLGKESSVDYYSRLAYSIGSIFKIHYLYLSNTEIIKNRITLRNEKQHRQTQIRQEELTQYLKKTPNEILSYLEKFAIDQIVVTKSKIGFEESGADQIMEKIFKKLSGQS